METDPLDYFCDDYADARARFRRACEQAELAVATHRNPAPAPSGVELTTDVACVGPEHAHNLLVLVSGVHGVETLCGSGCQTGWLESGAYRQLPRDTAVILVHAINCWGAAWGRRNTEGNVDLCRNFVDFSQPLPRRPVYEDIHGAIACPQLRGPQREAADEFMRRFLRERGLRVYMEALMGGQYAHADGFQFGGQAPVWSNRTLLDILRRHRGAARKVSVVEYHSGVGPWGYGSIVTMHTGSELLRARRIFGGWVLAVNEREPGTPDDHYQVFGHTTEGYQRVFAGAELTVGVLEFGTYPPPVSMPTLLQDHWLEHFGDPGDEDGRRIRARLWELHHPRDPEWRRAVWSRSTQVIRQALAGFSS